MNKNESNEDDKRLFDKMKQTAKEEKWTYTKDQFRKDVQEFHDKIKQAWQVSDLIETRININTSTDEKNKVMVDDTFWAWSHIYQDVNHAYHATQRYRP